MPKPDLADLLQERLELKRFRFARRTYGGEMTFHFGKIRRTPRLKKPMGEVIVSTRCSRWLVTNLMEVIVDDDTEESVKAVNKSIPGHPLTQSVWVDDVKPSASLALSIRLMNSSLIQVIPMWESEPQDPEIADWEVLTPEGMFRVGPGDKWEEE